MKVLASARRENDGSAGSKLDMYMTELSAIESELEATEASLGGPKRLTRKTPRNTENRRSKGKRKIHPAPQPSQTMMPHLESALGKDKERSLRCNASKPSIASSDAGNVVDDDLVELAETAAPEPESNETAKRITESTRVRSPARRPSRRPSPGKPQPSISKSPESTRDELKRLKMRQAALDAEARAHADAIRAEQRKTDKIHRERRASREIARKVEANRRFKASLQLRASSFRSTSSSSSTGTSSGTSPTSRAGGSISSALDVAQASSVKKSSRLRPKSARRPKPSCNKGEEEAHRPATASETHTKKSSHKQQDKQQHQKQTRIAPTSAQVRPLIQQQTDSQWTKQEQPAWKKTWDILEHGSASPRARPRSSRSAGSSSSFQSSRSSGGSEMESAQPLSDRSEATDFGPRSSETTGTELDAYSTIDRKSISGDGNESAPERAVHEKKQCAKPSETAPLGGGDAEDDADENILGEHQDPSIKVETMDSIERKNEDIPIEIKAANTSASPSRKDVPEGAQEEEWQEKGTIPEREVERDEGQSDRKKKDAEEEEEEEEVQTGFMIEVNEQDEDANKTNEDDHIAQTEENNHEEVQATRLQQERQSLASQPDASLAAALVALSEAERTVCQGQKTQRSPQSPSCSEKVDKMRSELYGSEWRATFPDFQSCTSRICQDLDELTIQMGRKMQFVAWDDSLEDEYQSLFGTKDGQARQMDANGGTVAAAASAAAEGAAAAVVAAKGAADAARGAAAAAEGAASAADAVTALADDLRVAAEAANLRWGVELQHQSAGTEKEKGKEPHGTGSVAEQVDHAMKQTQEMALSENANDATVTCTRFAESESLQQIANEEAKQIVEDTEAFATANVKENDAEQKHTEEELDDDSPQNVEKQVSSTLSTPVAASGDLQVDSDELERNTGDIEVAPKADGDKPVHRVEDTDEVATIPNASAKHTETQNDKGSSTTMVGSTSNADGESPTAKDAEVPRRRKTLW